MLSAADKREPLYTPIVSSLAFVCSCSSVSGGSNIANQRNDSREADAFSQFWVFLGKSGRRGPVEQEL